VLARAPLGERVYVWRETLRSGPGSELFRRYLGMAITCSLPQQMASAVSDDEMTTGDPALLIFRASICGRQIARLETLREGDVDFVDADLTLGPQRAGWSACRSGRGAALPGIGSHRLP
jgi:hypothetical protein